MHCPPWTTQVRPAEPGADRQTDRPPRGDAWQLLSQTSAVKDIRAVIKTLCQGTPEEQKEAVNRYFLPSASFVHPFCRIPSFDKVRVPILNNELNSRMLILAVYKWSVCHLPPIPPPLVSTR